MKTTKPDRKTVALARQLGAGTLRDDKSQYADKPRLKGESLLSWRSRCWGFPMPSFAPVDDNVLVWRLPPLSLSAGGLIIPNDQKSPSVKGVLLAMGPRARDVLAGNGIEEGHVVIFGRFAGWEAHDQTPERNRHNMVLMIKFKDVIGSDDLKAALDSGKMKLVQGDDGKHRLAVVEKKKLLPARKAKLLSLADSTHSPHEADTARKVAATIK